MSIFKYTVRAVVLTAVVGLAACGDDDENLSESTHLFYQSSAFDLQAHRGGLGLVVESTLDAFANAMELGVTTLELDIQITKDGVAVVTHDRQVSDKKCQDTGAVVADDPLYPYVGKYIKNLSLEQVKSLDCGSLPLTTYPQQKRVPGAKIATLREVFDLVKSYQADKLLLNVETKVEAGAPQETAPREQFVQGVVAEVRRANLINQVTIQSFDWGALMRVRELEPRLPIVALTNGPQFLQPGQEGASPWLGGIDIDDFDGDVVKAVKSFGADALSPVHGKGKYGDADYIAYTTAAMVKSAHAVGLKVIPWTVSDEATMNYLIDAGVDGIITDLPDVLRKVMQQRDLALPLALTKVGAN